MGFQKGQSDWDEKYALVWAKLVSKIIRWWRWGCGGIIWWSLMIPLWEPNGWICLWNLQQNMMRKWVRWCRLGNVTTKERPSTSSYWNSSVVLSLARWWRAEDAEKRGRDKETLWRFIAQTEAAMSCYWLS